MSQLLVQLLGVHDKNFRSYVGRLEQVCLNPGVDIRLAIELRFATAKKITELGLSGDNIEAEDVYLKLRRKLINDDKLLQEKLQIGMAKENDAVADKLSKVVSKLSKNEHALCLSAAATKRVLKAAPPTKTLRLLKLRSLNSVVKRFDPRMLYAVACLVESKSWRSQTHAKMKRVSDKDIVWASVEAIPMPEAWYTKLTEQFSGKGFYHVNRETATILVMPVVRPDRPGSTVLSLGLLLQAAHRLAMESLPYKRRSFIKGRQMVLPEIAHGKQPQLDPIHGLQPSWPVVYQLFGGKYIADQQYDSDILLGDLDWNSIEEKMAKIVPGMSFWVNTHYLAYPSQDRVVSFHIVDVAASLVANKLFGEQDGSHFESSLWNELQLRYLKEEVMLRALLKQLMSDEVLMVY